jgi:heme exporter protein B
MSMLLHLLKKDLLLEYRSKETIVTISLFALVLCFTLAFSFIGDPQLNLQVIPGILWACVLLVGTLSLGRSFAREQQNQVFLALVLSPIPRASILATKLIFNLLLSLSVLIVVVPLTAILLNIDLLPYLLELSLILFLGILGFSLIGTPLSVMAVNAKFPEVLLPIIVFPLVAPILICGVRGTCALLQISVEDDFWVWVQMMGAFNLCFGSISFYLFDWMVSE